MEHLFFSFPSLTKLGESADASVMHQLINISFQKMMHRDYGRMTEEEAIAALESNDDAMMTGIGLY